jgi:hypothetical protein
MKIAVDGWSDNFSGWSSVHFKDCKDCEDHEDYAYNDFVYLYNLGTLAPEPQPKTEPQPKPERPAPVRFIHLD